MTTGHLPIEEITRDRKRPKKTSTNSSIAREIFDGQHRKQLEIPTFIDYYNYYINSVDVANQLRATATVHFSRNEKEFFPGIFWAIDIILTNYWKIYESLYGPFISPTEKRQSTTHRTFLEALVELLFLYDSKKYAENVSGTSFKEYPKYSYIPHKTSRKPKETPLDFINLSRKTPLVFKGDSGRPRTSISAKITPISRHQHIKIIISGHCLICRNSNKIEGKRIAQRENIAYETIFQLSGETLKEVKPLSKDSSEKPKRIRGRKTIWKCSEYAVPICRPGEPCWDIAHKRLFSC